MKQLTIEEDIECREHLDRIFEITGGMRLSHMWDVLKEQMKGVQDAKFFAAIQREVDHEINSAYALLGTKIQEMLNNPVMQAEFMNKVMQQQTVTTVDVPTEYTKSDDNVNELLKQEENK